MQGCWWTIRVRKDNWLNNLSKKQRMKKTTFWGFVALLIGGCAKEKDLEPSGLDPNWFVVTDSADPVDHLRYEIFQETGVPIFRNDTIGSMDRGLDALGQPYIYYEILDVNYSITSDVEVATYKLCEEDAPVMLALELMRDEVIPRLPKALYPRCFLLVDQLNIDQTKNQRGEATAYKGMMTTVAGRLHSIGEMSDEELARWVAGITGEVISEYLYSRCAGLLEEFYSKAEVIARDGETTVNLYEFRYDIREGGTSETEPEYKDWKEYGFLTYDTSQEIETTEGKREYRTIGQRRDVETFMVEIMLNDETGFKSTYADYPLLLEKYDLLKAVWNKVKSGLQ